MDVQGEHVPEDAWQPLTFYAGTNFVISRKVFIVKKVPEVGQSVDEIVIYNLGERRTLDGRCRW